MTIINYKYYVSLEVAELLKEAGFNWKIRSLYDERNNFESSIYIDWNKLTTCKSAPTLELAQRWLREIKLCSVESYVVKWINRYQTNECTIFWKYIISSIDTSSQEAFCSIVDINNKFEFDSYQEALEAGIKKCLEIILKKRKIK